MYIRAFSCSLISSIATLIRLVRCNSLVPFLRRIAMSALLNLALMNPRKSNFLLLTACRDTANFNITLFVSPSQSFGNSVTLAGRSLSKILSIIIVPPFLLLYSSFAQVEAIESVDERVDVINFFVRCGFQQLTQFVDLLDATVAELPRPHRVV